MFEIKNFDNWIEDTESGKYGSGASEKMKNLLKKFIIDRKNRIINIYNLDSEV